MANYNNGKIYKVVNTIDSKIYIGSTTRALSARMGQHRSAANENQLFAKIYIHMRELGIIHFKILLIKSFPCNSKSELETEEFNLIQQCDAHNLLNESTVYKKHSEATKERIGDAQRGKKAHKFKYGCVFRREWTTSTGYVRKAWVFAYTNQETQKSVQCQFGINKLGEEIAHNLSLAKQKEIYPTMEE